MDVLDRPILDPLEYNNKSNQIKNLGAFKMTEDITK